MYNVPWEPKLKLGTTLFSQDEIVKLQLHQFFCVHGWACAKTRNTRNNKDQKKIMKNTLLEKHFGFLLTRSLLQITLFVVPPNMKNGE